MDNIDEFMQQKFGSDDPAGRFGFREEYWDQARILLESDEVQRRKRRRWLLWWVFAFAGLVAIPIWWYCHEKADFPSIYPSGTLQYPAGTQSDTVKLRDTGSAQEQGSASTDQVKNSADPESMQDVAVRSVSENKKAGKQHDDQLLSNEVAREGRSANASGELQAAYAGKKRPEDSPAKSRNLPATGLNAASIGASNKTNTAAEQAIASETRPSENPASANAKDFNQEQNIPAKNDIVRQETPESVKPQDELIPKRIDLFDPLPLPFNPVWSGKHRQTMPAGPAKVDVVQQTDVYRDKRWSGFAQLAASYYPGTQLTGQLGTVLGLSLMYNLKPDWSLSLGISGRFMPSMAANSDNNQVLLESAGQLRYGFGYARDDFFEDPRSFNMIEIPLAVHWQKPSWGSLEAGVMPGFLSAVRGRIVRYSSSSLQPVPEMSVEQRSASLDKSNYEQTFISLFAGAEWKASRRLGLFGKATYMQPNRWNKTQPLDLVKPQDLFWIDAGLRIRF